MGDVRKEWLGGSMWLSGPSLTDDPAKLAAFDDLVASFSAIEGVCAIDYRLAYAKHEFLDHLAHRRGYVLHGSNDSGIDRFEPRRQTDAAGRYVKRVFATPDGILPMYYAILDRSRYRGSLRNWYNRIRAADGSFDRFYRFSINQTLLERDPWRSGTVYVLQADTFTSSLDRDGHPTEEWTSESEVRPIAKITIEPSDFPFLDQVEGHDDRDAERLTELQIKLLFAFREAGRFDNGWRVSFRPTKRVAACIKELVRSERSARWLTDVTLNVCDDDPALLLISGPGAEALVDGFVGIAKKLKWLRSVPGSSSLVTLLWRSRRLGTILFKAAERLRRRD